MRTTHPAPTPVPALSIWLRASLPLLALASLLSPPPAGAHGGEDHSQPAVQAAPQKVAPSAAPSATPSAAPQRLPDASVWMPKPAQYRLGLRTTPARQQSHQVAIELNGRVLPDPQAGGRVQAAQAGRIEAGPQGLPMLGQRVTQGQVLAYLRPIANSLDRGNQLAMQAELEAQLAVADKRLQRYTQLEGAIPQKDVDAARIERDALHKRLQAVRGSVNAPEALIAPVSGVLASSNVVRGQVVEARDPVFEVVDPARLMVEALVYDPSQASALGDATASIAGAQVALRFAGAARQLRDQALPVLFRVVRSEAPLAVGQTLPLTAQTGRTIDGMALPRSALVRQPSGDTAVWLHDAPEHFSPRVVTVQPLDATRVIVTQGLRAGERVVTDGASLLAQVR